MNKDVIYIEPEDDITDIVTKIENSKEQIVAIVPPKKADILHSSINIRLIDKASKNADKKVVLVTTDTTVVKHAAAVKMPITKDLQTAPVIPSVEDEVETEPLEDEADFDELKNKKSSKKKAEEEAKEEVAETEKDTDSSEEKTEDEAKEEKTDEEQSEDQSEEIKEEAVESESTDKKSKKDKKKSKKDKKDASKNWFKKHRLMLSIGTPLILAVIGVIYWALAIAPAVDIKVKVRTTVDKLSENISFTTKIEEEDIAAGKFYLEEKKIESPENIKFNATGEKNVGEKATGSVIAYQYFKQNGATAINANSNFTSDGLTFYSTEDATLSWDGSNASACGNINDATSLIRDGCLVYARINVVAAGSGSSYNIPANTAWTTTANVAVYSDVAMSGGTDRTITVVTESDVNSAKNQLTTQDAKDKYKAQLFEGISDDVLPIDSSYVQKTSDIVSTPAVGEEVKEGVEPSIATTTTTSIYVVDMAKIREFITTKAKIPEKFLVYAVGNPFIENFTSVEGGFVGRLKTNYTYGPKLSEQGIIELIKGARIGNVKPILTDEGATDVEITRSYPWVGSVPNDVNKITVTIKEE